MIGLYYPYIHFRDESWLKLAALYWDKMARIVPFEIPVPDSDTVKQLIDAQFVRNYWPGRKEVDEVSKAFAKLIDQYEEALRRHYGIGLRDDWRDLAFFSHPRALSSRAGPDPRMEYVYLGKLEAALGLRLIELGLADRHPYDRMWAGMHPRLAFVYMSALAEQIARQNPNALYPVTEIALCHLAINGLTVEQLAQALLDDVPVLDPLHTERELETHLAMISFQYVIPKDIAHIPVEKIIVLRKRLRDKHGQELETYQNYLHTLVSAQEELKRATNLATLHDLLEDEYVHKIKPQLEDLKEELRLLNIDTITGAMNLNITIPSSLVTGAILLGISHLNPVVAGAGAIAMAVLKLAGDKQKRNKQTLQSSPVAYLLRVEKELEPKRLLSEISYQAEISHLLK